MGLKSLLYRKKLEKACATNVVVLPGEPMIYSCKREIIGRSHSGQHFRNLKWKSYLRCYFSAVMNCKSPVVVIVRFYVSPPEWRDIDPEHVKAQRPATVCHEICEYLLSFMQMLHKALILSYRQIVKVDASKFFSTYPRTEIQFMKWDTYAQLQSDNTLVAKAKAKRPPRKRKEAVQPECQGDEANT